MNNVDDDSVRDNCFNSLTFRNNTTNAQNWKIRSLYGPIFVSWFSPCSLLIRAPCIVPHVQALTTVNAVVFNYFFFCNYNLIICMIKNCTRCTKYAFHYFSWHCKEMSSSKKFIFLSANCWLIVNAQLFLIKEI